MQQGDELKFDIEVMGGPLSFRLHSETFSGFSFSLGIAIDEIINKTFVLNFNDQFSIEIFTSTENCGNYKSTLGGCVQNLIIAGQEDNTMEIESNNFIISNQDIQSTSSIDYIAKNFILLEADF